MEPSAFWLSIFSVPGLLPGVPVRPPLPGHALSGRAGGGSPRRGIPWVLHSIAWHGIRRPAYGSATAFSGPVVQRQSVPWYATGLPRGPTAWHTIARTVVATPWHTIPRTVVAALGHTMQWCGMLRSANAGGAVHVAMSLCSCCFVRRFTRGQI